MLTTHYMDEAEALCDRVAIMDHGRVLQLGPPAALVRGLDAPGPDVRRAAPAARPSAAARLSEGVRGRATTTAPRWCSPPGRRRPVLAAAGRARRAGRAAGARRHAGGRVPRAHRTGVPSMTAFRGDRRRHRQGLRARPDVAVLRDRVPADVPGAVRRRSSTTSSSPRIELVQVGDVPLVDELPAGAPRTRSTRPSRSRSADDLADAARATVRKGDADAAVEMQRRHARRALHADRPGAAAITQGTLTPFVDGANQAAAGAAAALHASRPSRSRTSRCKTDPVRHARPAGLGGRDERGVRRGRDAAGLAADSKLLRRLRLSPVLGAARWSARGSVVTRAGGAGADGDLRRPRDAARSVCS